MIMWGSNLFDKPFHGGSVRRSEWPQRGSATHCPRCTRQSASKLYPRSTSKKLLLDTPTNKSSPNSPGNHHSQPVCHQFHIHRSSHTLPLYAPACPVCTHRISAAYWRALFVQREVSLPILIDLLGWSAVWISARGGGEAASRMRGGECPIEKRTRETMVDRACGITASSVILEHHSGSNCQQWDKALLWKLGIANSTY